MTNSNTGRSKCLPGKGGKAPCAIHVEFSIMQLSCIQSWIWVKPELSSYRHQSSNQQYVRIIEEFRINVSDKGNLRSSK